MAKKPEMGPPLPRGNRARCAPLPLWAALAVRQRPSESARPARLGQRGLRAAAAVARCLGMDQCGCWVLEERWPSAIANTVTPHTADSVGA